MKTKVQHMVTALIASAEAEAPAQWNLVWLP